MNTFSLGTYSVCVSSFPDVHRYSGKYDSIAIAQSEIYLEPRAADAFQDEVSKLIQTFEKEPVHQFLAKKREDAEETATGKTSCVVCRKLAAKNRYEMTSGSIRKNYV